MYLVEIGIVGRWIGALKLKLHRLKKYHQRADESAQ